MKLYVGPIMRNLTHEQAREMCEANKELVLTRREWDGFHFVSDEGVYCILCKDKNLMVGAEPWDTDKKDWIVSYPNRKAIEILHPVKRKVDVNCLGQKVDTCDCVCKCTTCGCK